MNFRLSTALNQALVIIFLPWLVIAAYEGFVQRQFLKEIQRHAGKHQFLGKGALTLTRYWAS